MDFDKTHQENESLRLKWHYKWINRFFDYAMDMFGFAFCLWFCKYFKLNLTPLGFVIAGGIGLVIAIIWLFLAYDPKEPFKTR